VDTIVTNLARLSEKLDNGAGSAGRLFNDPSLYNNADQMLVETRNCEIRSRKPEEISDHQRSNCSNGLRQSGLK